MGTPPRWNDGKGKAYAWLVEHVGYQGDDVGIRERGDG